MTVGTGLRLHPAKTQALLLNESSRAAWAAAARGPDFALAPAPTPTHARYLGFQLGIDGE